MTVQTLGYAALAHRAQGAIVDTAHVFINSTDTRQTLYVAASRAKGENGTGRGHRT